MDFPESQVLVDLRHDVERRDARVAPVWFAWGWERP